MKNSQQHRAFVLPTIVRVFLVVAVAGACGPSDSEPVARAHLDLGAGTTVCSKYVEIYESNEDAQLVKMVASWTQGYLSAWNRQLQFNAAPPLKSFDPEVISLFIYRHCQDNPKKNVAAATLALIDDLSKPD